MEEVQLNTNELVSRSQAGCSDSFEQLVEQFERRLFTYLYRLVGNTHDAEDLIQETFVKVHRDLHRYRSEYSFSTWIYTIAKRTAYTFLKRRKPTESIQEDTRVEDADPSLLLESRESQDSIWELARKLKPTWREALWLRYGEDLSVAETAAIMETNAVRVRVILHRARNQLTQMLKQRQSTY
ncbi:RNA polymerase sigma factor [Verrucomicrobia bacterium]|nr:RNA polymerase sigma factor [Verrucomicrobiota bacterium]